MATEVLMPRLTYEMETGAVARWLKGEGDAVQVGDPLFEVETDKAITVVEAKAAGVLTGVRAPCGQPVAVGGIVAYIVAPGEAVPEVAPPAAAPREQEATPSAAGKAAAPTGAPAGRAERRPATPIARRIAREHGLNLTTVEGSGPGGRIGEADVWREIERRQEEAPAAVPAFRMVELSRRRRITGERLSAAQPAVPCFVLEVNADMRAAAALRERSTDAEGHRVSYSTILVKAAAVALLEHPEVNASFCEGRVKLWSSVNVGVAMAAHDGLVVPVIHGPAEMALREIDRRIQELRRMAEANALGPAELAGGTFTLSNLGMYGIDAFEAIINPPQAAILATGQIRELAVGIDGGIALRPLMNARLTVDHRVLDGASAAPFLARLKELIEQAQFPL